MPPLTRPIKISFAVLQTGGEVECAFKKDKKKYALNFDQDHLLRLPLNPRETHFGGRTNAVKLYYKCLGTEQIKY